MMLIRICSILFYIVLFISTSIFAAEVTEVEQKIQPEEPKVGSWIFSGMVNNESGDRYGYFFQLQRQGAEFHTKTALIDGQTNKLLMFYEGSAKIDNADQLDWHVGRSFMRYNPINDSWIFGIKAENETGFNFKVDMLKQGSVNNSQETLVLRPGVELQALQTSQLNGHVQTGVGNKEQFVTGNNAWFGKVWFSTEQESPHDISTTFCRLSNDTGFYSANLKESDATGAAVAGWRDATGNKVKMSQFLSIKSLPKDQTLLSLGLPKLSLKVDNTLKQEADAPLSVAGFFKESPKGFCFLTEHSFAKNKSKVAAG